MSKRGNAELRGEKASKDYVIRVVGDLAEIDAVQWNALLDEQPSATPFMRHEYLAAMQASGSADAASGWQAQYLVLADATRLVAACPLYLKDHSYGEYVFDWAWADAYRRHGLDYYPKLLDAVPFTPVPGPRLLARTPTTAWPASQTTASPAAGQAGRSACGPAGAARGPA